MKVQKSDQKYLFSFTVPVSQNKKCNLIPVHIQDSGGSGKNYKDRGSTMTLLASWTESPAENCDDSRKDIVETGHVVKKRFPKPNANVKPRTTRKKSVEFDSYSSSTEQQNELVKQGNSLTIKDLRIDYDKEKTCELSLVQSDKDTILDKFIRSVKMLKTKNVPKSVVLDMMKALSADILANAKTPEEKEAAVLNIGNVLLHEIQDKESDERHIEVLGKIDAMETEIKTLRQENMELKKNFGKLVELEESKAFRLVSRKQRKAVASKPKFAIFPQDMPIIMQVSQSGKCRYKIAKFRLAIIVLALTGFPISNLRFVNILQLDALFDKKTMIIKSINCKKNKFLTFPYAEEMKPYLDWVRADYDYIKYCQKEDSKKLYEIDYNHPKQDVRLLSPIWGYVNRSCFTRDLNSILKAAGALMTPKKNLTSKSFRRGIAITATRLFGVRETMRLLGHSSISSTEFYLEEEELGLGRLKPSLGALYAIKDSKKAKSYDPDRGI